MCIKFIVNPIKSDALVYNLNRTDYQSMGCVLIATPNPKPNASERNGKQMWIRNEINSPQLQLHRHQENKKPITQVPATFPRCETNFHTIGICLHDWYVQMHLQIKLMCFPKLLWWIVNIVQFQSPMWFSNFFPLTFSRALGFSSLQCMCVHLACWAIKVGRNGNER